jgi:hypothetical protein
MYVANMLGFSRGVALQSVQEVCSSGAVGILSVDKPEMREFIEGGRALERLWLTAQSEGLGFHPMASVPVFIAHAQRTDGSALLLKHRSVVEQIQHRCLQLLPQLATRSLQMTFRAGFGPPPPVRSLRRPGTDCTVSNRSISAQLQNTVWR